MPPSIANVQAALPSLGATCGALERSSDLQIVHVDGVGPHYAATRAVWRRRSMEGLDEVRRLGFGDSFVRLWLFYLCYCEAGFLERTTDDLQIVLGKPEDRGRPLLGRPPGRRERRAEAGSR